MKVKNLNDEQLETAINAARMLLSVDVVADFLPFTAFRSVTKIENLLVKEAIKRDLDI